MKSIPALFLLFFAHACIAQSVWYHFPEEFYFVKEVPITMWHGKNFRYEIAVKANPSDTLSKVRIHGIAVGRGKNDFINSPFNVESRTEQDWMVYTVVGTIDTDASKLWFYAAVNGNGNFYFDDVSFYVEDTPHHWRQLRLFNSSFEEKSQDIFAGYFVSRRKSPTLQTKLSREFFKTGGRSLLVTTSGAEPARSIVVSQ